MRFVLFFIFLLSLTSCAVLPHLDEAVTLKEYSDEKDSQKAYVAEQDRKFDELWTLVSSGNSLQQFTSRADFITRFGDPVLVQKVRSADGTTEERLLYRHATQYFNGAKVYAFFDEAGHLKRVEHEAAKP